MSESNDEMEVPVTLADASALTSITRGELLTKIEIAHKYPRNLTTFKRRALEMVTFDAYVAADCNYALPRDGKTIMGPTARFGEIMVCAWKNCQAGARVVSEGEEFITAQGAFMDLENNTSILFEVQRRIVDSRGKRYKPDMIGVTGNAASSIALRNAILKGIPKAFWNPMYQAALQVIKGDTKTLSERRQEAIKLFGTFGVTPDMIFQLIGVTGIADINIDHMVVLGGLLTALREGDTTVEQAFGEPVKINTGSTLNPMTDEQFAINLPKWRKAIFDGKRTADEIIAMVSTKGILTEEQQRLIRGEENTQISEAWTPTPEEQAAILDKERIEMGGQA